MNMTQPGYQEGSGRTWWWKVAQQLDEAKLAAINAMAHNLDDQPLVLAFQDKLTEAQSILLEIFRAKGLLSGSANGTVESPRAVQEAAVEASSAGAPTVAAEGSAAAKTEEPAEVPSPEGAPPAPPSTDRPPEA